MNNFKIFINKYYLKHYVKMNMCIFMKLLKQPYAIGVVIIPMC